MVPRKYLCCRPQGVGIIGGSGEFRIVKICVPLHGIERQRAREHARAARSNLIEEESCGKRKVVSARLVWE